jgi:hypothetical protein
MRKIVAVCGVLLACGVSLGGDALKTIAKVGNIEVKVQGYVEKGITFADWKSDGKDLSCTILWKEGPTSNVRWDTYDSDNVRIAGSLFSSNDFVRGEKTRKKWKDDGIRTIKITRELAKR